jgi:hypothetical protein
MEDALRQALAAGIDGDLAERAVAALGSLPASASEPEVFAFKMKVGTALRRVFDAVLDDEQLTPAVLDDYLALAQLLVRRQLTYPALPLHLFADLFDARPLEECKRFWGILEDKSAVMLPVAELRCNNRSELMLLQLSNALLVRTSKVMDTDFAGRIHVFLARLLPLEHKAFLNLGGNFHTENVTAFEPATSDDEVRPSARPSSIHRSLAVASSPCVRCSCARGRVAPLRGGQLRVWMNARRCVCRRSSFCV